MINIHAELSSAEIEKLMGALQLSKEACRRAARRAVAKTAKWTQTQAARTISSQLRIQQKAFRGRLRLYRQGEGMEQKVWMGLNYLAARRLGVPKRTRGGTRVGRHFFEGAFPIQRYGGGVYRRTGKGRFPLEIAKLEIDQAGAAAMRAAADRAEDRLMEIFRQELLYEFSKVTKRG